MPDDNFVSSVVQFFTRARRFRDGKSARLKSRDRRRRKPRQADFGSPLAEKVSPRGTKIAKRTGFQPENAAVGRPSPGERRKVRTTLGQRQAVFPPPHGKKRRTEAARPPSESLISGLSPASRPGFCAGSAALRGTSHGPRFRTRRIASSPPGETHSVGLSSIATLPTRQPSRPTSPFHLRTGRESST